MEETEYTRFEERAYGESWAQNYDQIFDEVDDAMIEMLVELSGSPPRALELAVGTGRVAIPLSESGVAVTGVDLSEPMLDHLASKPGGDRVQTVVGDMVDVPVDGVFPLVYLVFNSLFAISTQDRQVRCFKNVAEHLTDGGRFLLECFVPDMKRFDAENTRMSVSEIGDGGEHAYDMAIHDPVHQEVRSLHVRRGPDTSTRVLPVNLRYVWPSEMDLMARLAGLELEARWSWYERSEFNESSAAHVSVYRKPDHA